MNELDVRERLKTNVIPPIGPLDASICFIGQSPGADEDYQCQPFVGAAGQFLDRCLAGVGLPRSSVLINNVFNQRPPKNDAGYFFTDKSKRNLTWEGQEHVDRLKRWLQGLNPKPRVVVALGYEAMYVLTGKKRVWKWRGSVMPCTLVDGLKVYITLHPSGVLRLINEPETKLMGRRKELANNALPLFMRDIERIIEQSEFPEIKRPLRTFDLDLTETQLLGKLKQINDENADCAVDIETLPGRDGPIVWCIGFAPSPERAFVVPFIKGWHFAWPLNVEAQLLRAISTYFLNPKARKIFQYGNFDLAVLGKNYGLRVAEGTYEDTMWCHHATYPMIKKSLETLCSIYTWEPYYKDEGKVNYGKRSGDMAEYSYNAKDCCCTREIFPIVERNAKSNETWEGYRRSMSFMPSLLGMMIRGVLVDVKRKDELEKLFAAQSKFHHDKVMELEGEVVNLNSPKQMIALLYYKHQFAVQHNHKTGRPTADRDALQKLHRMYPNEPVLTHILEFRKFNKLHNTYAKMELSASDNRVRTSYGFVSTWRLTSSESVFGSGGNLQNIPIRSEEGREIRKLFITDERPEYDYPTFVKVQRIVARYGHSDIAEQLINGRKLMVRIDLSQAEARDVAWEAQDHEKMQQFLDPKTDVHWENAKIVFDLPRSLGYAVAPKKVQISNPITHEEHSHYDYRRLGKTVVHAANYGMGPKMLQIILAREGFIIPMRVAKQLLEGYLGRNPRLASWHREIRDKIRATRTLISSYGRKRMFYGRFNDNLWRVAYAFSPQNTVGEMLENMIQRTWSELYYVQPLLNVHDEMVAQIDPHMLPQAVHDLKAIFEQPIVIKGNELVIPAEFSIGMNWGACAELTNETIERCVKDVTDGRFEPDLDLCSALYQL
jgi:uracil-DNA glycosylase family 4